MRRQNAPAPYAPPTIWEMLEESLSAAFPAAGGMPLEWLIDRATRPDATTTPKDSA